MWQTVENKAKFINQVMNGRTTVRVAEDIDTAALSYAEVKAIASGNPLILEKMEVDTEVQRLQVLHSSYRSSRYSMQDEAHRIPKHIEKLTAQIQACRKDILALNGIKKESRFAVEIKGKSYTDYKDAGKELQNVLELIKTTDRNMGQKNEVEVGLYLGFELKVGYKRNFFVDDEEYIILKGEGEYKIEMSKVPSITAQRMEDELFSIEDKIKRSSRRIEKHKKQLSELDAELAKPFEYEEKLKKLVARQRELNIILDKSKASELVDAEEEIV